MDKHGRLIRKSPHYYVKDDCPKCHKRSYPTAKRASHMAERIESEEGYKMFRYWCPYARAFHLSRSNHK